MIFGLPLIMQKEQSLRIALSRRERLVSLIRYMVENIGKKRLVFAFFKNLF